MTDENPFAGLSDKSLMETLGFTVVQTDPVMLAGCNYCADVVMATHIVDSAKQDGTFVHGWRYHAEVCAQKSSEERQAEFQQLMLSLVEQGVDMPTEEDHD